MTTQAVVIYTPVQDALYNGGLLLPLIAGGIIGFVVFIVLMKVAELVVGQSRISDLTIGGAGVAALVAAGLVFHNLAN